MSRRVRASFPREVQVLEHVWIPLSDGCRLSARVWLPADAERSPVPAILEYLPYRKGDATAIDDSLRHPYLAGNGYAAVRVDIRGSGDSEGILLDEYHRQEQDDALETIAWLAEQPWCTGAVGMMGISWGGFNSLQVAARRPPALKAVVTACSTDDRYADDVHYMGGSVLAYYLLAWATVMAAYNARPPDPAVVGERWRRLWLERLEGSPLLIDAWLEHQRRDAYWKHGSVCEDYAAIECAVYAVGGWADAYTNAIFRLLAGLSCPKKALIGPWGHMWPEEGVPGPAIGFLQESLRWWDHWLKSIDTGVMDEPVLRAWMQEAVEPAVDDAERPGRWIAEPTWPPAGVERRTYAVNLGGLAARSAPDRRVEHSSPQTVGIDAGAWCPYGNPADLPADQRRDDSVSLCFLSEPLAERIELFGQPELELTFDVDRPTAFVAVRLSDVLPGGASTLVTRAILNLCHRDGHEHPAALEPGRVYRASVRLNAVAYAVPAGHRLRLALSTSYWPWIWPSPEPVTIGVHTGGASSLHLPVRPGRPEDAALRAFAPPETALPLDFEWIRPREPELSVTHDVPSGRVELRMARAFFGSRRLPSGIEYCDRDPVAFTIVEGDPLSARVECTRRIEIGRGDWQTRVEVRSVMTGDESSFHVSTVLDAYEGETRVHTRASARSFPRDHG